MKDGPLPYGTPDNDAGDPFAWVPGAISFVSRSRVIVAAATAACLVLAVIYLLTATPKFDATTSMLIDLRQAELFQQQAKSTDSQVWNAVVESQVEILRSIATSMAAVKRMSAEDRAREFPNDDSGFSIGSVIGAITSLFGGATPDEAGRADLLQAIQLGKMSSVRRVGATTIIELSVRSKDPKGAAFLANAMADAYIAEQLDAKYEVTRRGGEWLQVRLAELREQGIKADRAVQDYKAKMNIVDTDKGLMSERQVGDLQTALTVAQGRTSEAKARYDRIDEIIKSGVKDGVVADVAQNPVIVRLRQQYFDTSKREADISAKYGQNHVAAVNARAEMAEIDRSLRGELSRIAEIYRSDYEVARSGEQSVREQLDKLISLAAVNNQSRVELRSLESSSSTYRSLYENFLQKYTQAVQDQSFPISDARIVARAEAPLRKSWPKGSLVLGGALVLGIGFGLVVAFLNELIRRSIRTSAQVEQATGVPCVATLPRLRSLVRPRGAREWARKIFGQRNPENNREFMLDTVAHPMSALAEAMQGIKLLLDRRVARVEVCRLVGLISAVSGEGKSTVASNLAHYLAQTGKRVLLLDWDLRSPTLSKTLAAESSVGLIESIESGTPQGLLASKTRGMPLHILPTVIVDRGTVHASEILRSSRNVALLESFKSQYDYILVDLPPMADFVDVRATGDLIDAYLFVVGYNVADKGVIAECVSQEKFDTTRLIGSILNGVDPRQFEQRRSRITRYLPWMQRENTRYATGTASVS